MMSTDTRPSPSALIRRAASPRERDDQVKHGPYATQQELIDDQLAAVRARLRAAMEHLEAASTSWPSELIAAEERIAMLVQAAAVPLPATRLRDRFALSDGEEIPETL